MGICHGSDGGVPSSGRNDQYNSNFIGTLTYPNDGINKSKTSWTEEDGGISFPSEKYYDKYTYGEDAEHYNRRILGDATGEMGPFTNVVYGSQTRQIGSWYADEVLFVDYGSTWFERGANGCLGTGAGVFTFFRDTGRLRPWSSFRVVLAF